MSPAPDETQPPFAVHLLPTPLMPTADHNPGDPSDQKRLQNIEAAVYEIRSALVGNPKLGHRGLFQRVETIEDRVEKHDRKLLVWGTVLTAAGTAATFLKDKLWPSS